MSFIGRAAAWTYVNSAGDIMDGPRSNRRPDGSRLTPLDVMTGSRIAASGNGVGLWVHAQTWDEAPHWRSVRTDLARSPYQQLFEAISRRTNRAPEFRTCPRCGQAQHNDWGHEYERLVCQEITIG